MADVLGAFEQAVLLAIVRLRDEAYGRAILKEVQARLERDVAAGAVHATLGRLEQKGLLASRLGVRDADPRRPRAAFLPAAAFRAARAQRGARDHRQPLGRPSLAAERTGMMWTTAVLSLLMPPDEAETVAGDLIEEYRDTVYPAAGKWRADFWLARQVAGFVWRVPLAWGLAGCGVHCGPVRGRHVRPARELRRAIVLHDLVIDPAVPDGGRVGRPAHRPRPDRRAARRGRARDWMGPERRRHHRPLRRA